MTSLRYPSALLCVLLFAAVQAAAQPHDHRHGSGHSRDGTAVDHWLPRLESEGRDEWQKPAEVTRLLDIEPPMVLVDIGAGTGYFLAPLSEAAGREGRVLALDVDEDLVAFMAERILEHGFTNAEARRIAFDDPGLEDGSVDRILIVNTWHHIGERSTYAERLKAALAPGGQILVVDFTLDSPHGPPSDHRLPAETVIAELEAAGLKAGIASENLPYQYAVMAR